MSRSGLSLSAVAKATASAGSLLGKQLVPFMGAVDVPVGT